MSNFYQKGASLYIALVILSLILSVILALNMVLLEQMRMIRTMGYSIIAYYAAETGIERALYQLSTCNQVNPFNCVDNSYAASLDIDGDNNAGRIDSCPGNLTDFDDACYQFLKSNINDCGAVEYCFRAAGYYKGVRRAVEIKN